MKVYYTTSAGTDSIQKDPKLSLGGFKSSIVFKNDDFSNLFGELTPYTISKDKNEYIALILKNETDRDVLNVNLWFEVNEDSYSKYQLAVVILALDENGEYQMERVTDRYTKPFVGEFIDSDVNTKFNIGQIDNSKMIGIWIKRELLIDKIKKDLNDLYEVDPNNIKHFIPKEKEKIDILDIKISWD